MSAFEELPKRIQDMLNSMKGKKFDHVEVMTAADLVKLNGSIETIAAKLPRLCFGNAATVFFYTGFTTMLSSMYLNEGPKAIDLMVGHPKWQYNTFKDVVWRPVWANGKESKPVKKLKKGDRLCICMHHLKGLTVMGYYLAGMMKEANGVVLRTEFAGGVSFPFREYTDTDDELPMLDLFTMPSDLAPKPIEGIFDGLEDMDKFIDWEAPANKDYFKG